MAEGGSGGTFLNIPGNIKQKNLPFVLDPDNEINKTAIDIAEDNGKAKSGVSSDGSALLFSFKPKSFGASADAGPSAEKSGFLRIAPGSFYCEHSGNKITYTKQNTDLAYKLIYNNGITNDDKKSASASDILNTLPSISVREFLQDSKLNLLINLFLSVVTGWDAGIKTTDEKSQEAFLTKLWKFTKALVKNIPGILKDSVKPVFAAELFDGITDENEKAYIAQIPFVLYYRLISATTTNIYELPYNGKILYLSNGVNGWNVDNGFGGFGSDSDSIFAKILNYVGGNIKISTTPTWSPKDGGERTNVEITFDLYNDTLDGAIKNFIFINTIIPGNKYLQYHIYLHAPNLYDVRINGINRLFMCAATFKVEQVGVLRIPSKKFFEKLVEHINNDFKITDPKQLATYIRIPDMYRITAKFESLLPDSFNNYIYQYYINSPIPTKITGTDLHPDSAYETVSTNIVKNIKTLWDNPDAIIGSKK